MHSSRPPIMVRAPRARHMYLLSQISGYGTAGGRAHPHGGEVSCFIVIDLFVDFRDTRTVHAPRLRCSHVIHQSKQSDAGLRLSLKLVDILSHPLACMFGTSLNVGRKQEVPV
jgi:hypothetical protein